MEVCPDVVDLLDGATLEEDRRIPGWGGDERGGEEDVYPGGDAQVSAHDAAVGGEEHLVAPAQNDVLARHLGADDLKTGRVAKVQS